MEANVSNPAKDVSSVGILKEYIGELPIKNLDSEWIRNQKVDLDSLMVDSHPGSGRNILSQKFIR
ncbi:hypothetical protein [Methanolobus sp. WCC4]|uniref:hypothetical protein n=1 Tax=Methanolobus sp. WCC4 TaxID=3125784 RepID=UPI0030FAE021